MTEWLNVVFIASLFGVGEVDDVGIQHVLLRTRRLSVAESRSMTMLRDPEE